MILALVLAAAVPQAAPAVDGCSPAAQQLITLTRNMKDGIARVVGLSPAGGEVFVKVGDEDLHAFCFQPPTDRELAHERVLELLAQDKVDRAQLSRAVEAEVQARVRAETKEVEERTRMLLELSSPDRQKLAKWYLDQERQSRAKQAKLLRAE